MIKYLNYKNYMEISNKKQKLIYKIKKIQKRTVQKI